MVRSVLFIFILTAACILVPENSFGQCDINVELVSIRDSSSDINDGKISFKVKANGNGSFECILSEVSGIGITELEKKYGFGEMVLEFEKLEPGKFYQVLIIFNDENHPLCKKRILSDIIIERK
jgi:hypothetical protein